MGGQHTKNGSLQNCVRIVPLFNHLAPNQLTDVMTTVHSAHYPAGTHLFHAGDQSDALYIIHTGKVRLYRLSDSGREQLIRLLSPGDFTGELALFLENKHESFAEVIEASQICKIARTDLRALLIKYPAISLQLLRGLARRLEESEQKNLRVATETIQARLLRFLLTLVPANQKQATIYLPMSKKNLAAYLGTSPETISRTLSKLEKNGYLKQYGHRGIFIEDIELLKMIDS